LIILTYFDDNDDDVYLDRITQQKPKNCLPNVKYRQAREGGSTRKEQTIRSMQQPKNQKSTKLLETLRLFGGGGGHSIVVDDKQHISDRNRVR
jgi:hypothetical protein